MRAARACRSSPRYQISVPRWPSPRRHLLQDRRQMPAQAQPGRRQQRRLGHSRALQSRQRFENPLQEGPPLRHQAGLNLHAGPQRLRAIGRGNGLSVQGDIDAIDQIAGALRRACTGQRELRRLALRETSFTRQGLATSDTERLRTAAIPSCPGAQNQPPWQGRTAQPPMKFPETPAWPKAGRALQPGRPPPGRKPGGPTCVLEPAPLCWPHSRPAAGPAPPTRDAAANALLGDAQLRRGIGHRSGRGRARCEMALNRVWWSINSAPFSLASTSETAPEATNSGHRWQQRERAEPCRFATATGGALRRLAPDWQARKRRAPCTRPASSPQPTFGPTWRLRSVCATAPSVDPRALARSPDTTNNRSPACAAWPSRTGSALTTPTAARPAVSAFIRPRSTGHRFCGESCGSGEDGIATVKQTSTVDRTANDQCRVRMMVP